MTPSQSMPQKSDTDFKRKHPYVLVGTLVAMRIEDIKSCFCLGTAFLKVAKEVEMIFVIDRWLNSLMMSY